MKVLDVIWFDNIGIVVIENLTGEKKAYIGEGDGINEDADIQHIVKYGKPVYPVTLERILDLIKISEKVGGTD